MNSDFAFIGLMTAIALVFPVIPLVFAKLLGPKKAAPMKNATYECGLEVTGDSWIQFRVQYYLYALIFVIFDVETVFLFPWAVSYGVLGWFALVEMFIFVGVLVLGLAYAWRKGALEWA
jgi:NADH:ubiquinone oxidoreductase subunit 3 (subunit A)